MKILLNDLYLGNFSEEVGADILLHLENRLPVYANLYKLYDVVYGFSIYVNGVTKKQYKNLNTFVTGYFLGQQDNQSRNIKKLYNK
jgi:hypothetical protein